MLHLSDQRLREVFAHAEKTGRLKRYHRYGIVARLENGGFRAYKLFALESDRTEAIATADFHATKHLMNTYVLAINTDRVEYVAPLGPDQAIDKVGMIGSRERIDSYRQRIENGLTITEE